jgi:hypothetical protein
VGSADPEPESVRLVLRRVSYAHPETAASKLDSLERKISSGPHE